MTISNIQYCVYVNSNQMITGMNVVYEKTNPDGSRDKVERVFMRNMNYYNHYNSLSNTSFYITPTQEELNGEAPYGLKKYISRCESSKGLLSFPQNNLYASNSFTGEVVKNERLSSPSNEVIPKLTQEIQSLSTQVQALTQANISLAKTNQNKDKEIAEVKDLLNKLNNLLGNLNQ